MGKLYNGHGCIVALLVSIFIMGRSLRVSFDDVLLFIDDSVWIMQQPCPRGWWRSSDE